MVYVLMTYVDYFLITFFELKHIDGVIIW